MGYSVSFLDNEYYGADDINAIRRAFASKGVIKKTDDSCRVSVSDGKITIAPGDALFEDGAMISVNEPEQLELADGYVCFDRGTGSVIVSDTVPDGGICLARISDGAVTDSREVSAMTVPSMAVNCYYEKTLHMETAVSKAAVYEVEFDEITGFRFAFVDVRNSNMRTAILYDFEKDSRVGMTFANGDYQYVYVGICSNPAYLSGSTVTMTAEHKNGKLILTLNNNSAQTIGFDAEVTVI